MPVHDWTRVDAGIFHDFHHGWIEEIKRALNRGLLPSEYYALAEQIAGGLGPDVLTLKGPAKPRSNGSSHGVALATAPPNVRFHLKAEVNIYATKAKAVVIRHKSKHDVIAMVEIVSPGNKNSKKALTAFVRKTQELIAARIHLLIADLFPPRSRDPQGLHPLIWEDRNSEEDFVFSAAQPLTCVSYLADDCPEAFIEPVAVGDPLPDMPLFLTPEDYVPLPLEATYLSAFDAVPEYWRDVIAASK